MLSLSHNLVITHSVVRVGLEPTTFCVSGRRSKPTELHDYLVGVAGVEPAASWSQTKRLSPRLYPVTVGGRRGARTLASISRPNGLANRPLHQLEYPSIRSLLGIRTQTLSSVAIGANPLHQETKLRKTRESNPQSFYTQPLSRRCPRPFGRLPYFWGV